MAKFVESMEESMGINLQEHFENQIDAVLPETARSLDRIAEFSEENPYDDSFEDMISAAQGNHLGYFEKDIVFSSIADTNYDYGKGGGNQYFIQNAVEMKRDGRLAEISREEFNVDTDTYKADIRSSNDIYDSLNKKQIDDGKAVSDSYSVHFDSRGIPEEELKEMEMEIESKGQPQLSDISKFNKDLFPVTELTMDEIEYLDENTPSADALTRVEIGQQHEDYFHPLGNQEDSRGFNHPDAWSNPKELQNGDVYYQLSPVLKDGEIDTKSSYFTDKETVESCRSENGVISLSALMQKLQVAPKVEMTRDENGDYHEEHITKYIVTEFEYSSKSHK